MVLSEEVKGLSGKLLSNGEFQSIAFATEKEQVHFLTFLEREKFLSSLDNPGISCVLVTPELADKVPAHIRGVYVCDRPKSALFRLHNALSQRKEYVGESVPSVTGKRCNISPLAFIDSENVIIGDDVTIEPFVTIKGRVRIGNHVTIRSGTVIGGKGFSFSKDETGRNVSVIDTAGIIIEDWVDILENVNVSAGIFPWERSVIGENTKIDAQCQIAHGLRIGKNCLLANGCRCCGNCRIGDNTWIGVGAIVSNRVEVGSNARVSIGAVATKNVPDGATVTGNFAIPHATFLRNLKASLAESKLENNPIGGGQSNWTLFPHLSSRLSYGALCT